METRIWRKIDAKTNWIERRRNNNDRVTDILEGKIMEKRPRRGTFRQSYFKDINHWMGYTSYRHLKNTMRNREIWLQRQGLVFGD